MALYVKADLHLKLQLVRLEVLVVAEVRALHRVDELMLVPLAASNSDWKKPVLARLLVQEERQGWRTTKETRPPDLTQNKHLTRRISPPPAVVLEQRHLVPALPCHAPRLPRLQILEGLPCIRV